MYKVSMNKRVDLKYKKKKFQPLSLISDGFYINIVMMLLQHNRSFILYIFFNVCNDVVRLIIMEWNLLRIFWMIIIRFFGTWMDLLLG